MRPLRFPLPGSLQQLPLASLGLAAVWLLSLAVTELGFGARLVLAQDKLLAAAHFAIEHPEVEVGARLLPVARAVMPGFESNEMFAFLRGRGAGGDTQRQLDALADEAFRELDAHPQRALGFVPARPSLHGPLAHALVHAGWTHGLASVLLLLLLAPSLERLWGRRVLATALVGMALCGAGAFAALRLGAELVLVGGGALLAGCAAALVARFRGASLDFLRWTAPLFRAELSAPAWAAGVLWAGYALLLFWMPRAGTPGTEVVPGLAAQAAGALVGAGVALLAQRRGWERRFGSEPPVVIPTATEQAFCFRRVLEARARGDHDAAFAWLAAEVQRSGRNRDAVITFFSMCVEREEVERAVPALGQLICEELRRGADEVALAQWRELHAHAADERLPPETLLQLAPTAQRLEGDEVALVLLHQVLEAPEAALPAASAARVARLAAELDPETALRAARRGLATSGLVPGERVELEALVSRFGQPDAEEKPDESAPRATPNVFYEESDRSAFDDAGEWSALDDFPNGSITEAVPLRSAAAGVMLDARGRGELPLAFTRIRAVALVGVRGLGPRPVVLIDLLVDGGGTERPLGVMRLRSDAFDPRRFAAAGAPLEALLSWVAELLERSGARPLPDADSAAGRPMRVFDGLDDYHAQILRSLGAELA